MRNLKVDEVIHLDYEKYGPVTRNLGDNDVIHVDYEKHVSVVSNLVDDEVIYTSITRNMIRSRESLTTTT